MTADTYESLPWAAARIGVSVKTLRRRIGDGMLPAIRSGRLLRLDPGDVDALFRRYDHVSAAERTCAGRRPARRAS